MGFAKAANKIRLVFRNSKDNKTGLQPNSKTVEQQVGFLTTLKVDKLSYNIAFGDDFRTFLEWQPCHKSVSPVSPVFHTVVTVIIGLKTDDAED